VVKKKHTVKNNVMADFTDRIYYLSDTYEGSVHDKKICDEESLEKIENTEVWQDTGYQGFRPANSTIVQPNKKRKGVDLSTEQKEQNKEKSRKRVYIEHTMRGIKIYRIISERLRNLMFDFKDKVMETVCGLHNFIIEKRPMKKQPDFA
jgi:hypothetical protein